MTCSKVLIKLSALLLSVCAMKAVAQTVTLTSLTSNNTSACPASGTLPVQCSTSFTGQTDTTSGVATALFDRPPGNISTEDPHTYLNQGTGTRILANFMLAYCNDTANTLCNGNVQVGYTANNTNTVAAQVEDLRRRHIDGAVMTWEGAGTSEDQAALKFQAYVNAHYCSGAQQCDPMYLNMWDGPSYKYSVTSTGAPGTSGAPCTPVANGTTAQQTAFENCYVAHVENDMCYMNGSHWGNNAYQKLGGRPIVQVFPSEDPAFLSAAASGSPSWADAWTRIGDFNKSLPANCGSAPYNANNGVPLLVFEDAGGFTHTYSTGSYYWVEPATGVSNQFTTNISGSGSTLDNFFVTAQTYPSEAAWGGAFKGFNDSKAPWGSHRVMDQQCGQVWIKTLKESNNYYSSAALPYLEIGTWNDYNEGTEIESGIDNCYTASGSVSGQTLTWTLNPTNTSYASLSTVSHVEIYDSSDGANLTMIASLIPAASGTYNLSGLSTGTHHLFTRMVGKNSILNRMSTSVSFTK